MQINTKQNETDIYSNTDFFACSKDEKSNTLSSQKSEQDVFNAVVGTWIFNRMGYDLEFKKVKKFEIKECAEKDYTIMRSDGTITCIDGCWRSERTGTFYIEFGGSFKGDTDVHIRTVKGGLNLIPDMGYSSGGILHSYTDSTLVIGAILYQDTIMYSELKRVK